MQTVSNSLQFRISYLTLHAGDSLNKAVFWNIGCGIIKRSPTVALFYKNHQKIIGLGLSGPKYSTPLEPYPPFLLVYNYLFPNNVIYFLNRII
jgi:hypothetical protein